MFSGVTRYRRILASTFPDESSVFLRMRCRGAVPLEGLHSWFSLLSGRFVLRKFGWACFTWLVAVLTRRKIVPGKFCAPSNATEWFQAEPPNLERGFPGVGFREVLQTKRFRPMNSTCSIHIFRRFIVPWRRRPSVPHANKQRGCAMPTMVLSETRGL